MTHLKDDGKYVKSVTILPNTARGGYDDSGDMGGHYHIYFSAYVNDNPKQSLNVELYFPDASIHAFTVVHPNPFKDKKKMKRWFIGDINTQLFSKSNLVHCLLTVDFKTFFSSPRITS